MDTARGAASKAISPRRPRPPALPTSHTQVRAKPLPSTTRRLRRGGVANVVVMTVAAGIVGTLAIPAYAFAPGSEGPQFGTSAETALTKAQAQIGRGHRRRDRGARHEGRLRGHDRRGDPRRRRGRRSGRGGTSGRRGADGLVRRGILRPLRRASSLANPAYAELRPRQRLLRRPAVPRRALRLRWRHPGRLRLLRPRHVRLRPVRHQPAALVGRPGRSGHAASPSRRPSRATSWSWTGTSGSTRATA